MRKYSFLERPRPSLETARTAGSCVSAEGHMTPAVSPAPRRRKLHIPRFRPEGRKLAHSAAPPLPSKTAALGFAGGPICPAQSLARNRAKSALKAPGGAGTLPCPEGGHTAPHRPLQRGIPLPQGTAYCGRKIRKYSAGPDTRCWRIISPH